MIQNLFPPNANDNRDILNEIQAGELDESYLVKHASDCGVLPAPSLRRALQKMIAYLSRAVRHALPKPIAKPMHPTARSAALQAGLHSKIEMRR